MWLINGILSLQGFVALVAITFLLGTVVGIVLIMYYMHEECPAAYKMVDNHIRNRKKLKPDEMFPEDEDEGFGD